MAETKLEFKLIRILTAKAFLQRFIKIILINIFHSYQNLSKLIEKGLFPDNLKFDETASSFKKPDPSIWKTTDLLV